MNLYQQLIDREAKLAVVGLGYVGLPLALAFSGKLDVIGFDRDRGKIESYRRGLDITGEVGDDALQNGAVDFTADADRLSEAKVFVVTVPTPLLDGGVPDLRFVESATRMIAQQMSKHSLIIYESTVYPGVTEDICIPLLEEVSGLRCGPDFKVGYSPERINPGDKLHRLDNVVKVVAGIDEETADTVARIYELIVKAGIFRAESIKAAEAAKVVENAQRDVNIAFMNEISMMLHKLKIPTSSVLEAASTKWNFLRFSPGLVGGHCIGVDSYYLTHKAETEGFDAQLIKAARRINESMGGYIAQQIIKLLVREQTDLRIVKIAVLGVTYKENCSDIRNSKVAALIKELADYGIVPLVVDPLADPRQVYEEYGLELMPMSEVYNVNMIVLAVPHRPFLELDLPFDRMYAAGQTKFFIDVKGVFQRSAFERSGYVYWSL